MRSHRGASIAGALAYPGQIRRETAHLRYTLKALQHVMIGTEPDGRGGIAAVIRIYASSDFFRTYRIRYVSTHTSGSALTKVRTALGAVGVLLQLGLHGSLGIVHAHSASRTSFLRKSALLTIARLGGARTVLHLHGGEFEAFAHRESGCIRRWWIRRSLEQATRVIVLSSVWRTRVLSMAPRARIEVLANPIHVRGEPGAASEQHSRILFLGGADHVKGVETLLEAVKALVPDFPHIRVVIAGPGDLQPVIRRASRLGISTNVECVGWLTSAERDTQLAQATLLALPSLNEGLPMALLEAMAAGRAVVATSVGGIPDLVRSEHDGLLVPPGDPGAFAAAIRRVLSDRILRNGLERAARETVRARYSVDAVLPALSKIYEGLGARPQTHSK